MSWRRDARQRSAKSYQPKFNPYLLPHERAASAIEARSGETGTGSTEGESASDAQTPQDTANDRH